MKKGDKVWLKPTSRNPQTDIMECVIIKIGRKYIEVAKNINAVSTIKFDISKNYAQVTSYSPDWMVYFSKQTILDEEETLLLANEIRAVLGDYGPTKIPLDKLREIKNILKS